MTYEKTINGYSVKEHKNTFLFRNAGKPGWTVVYRTWTGGKSYAEFSTLKDAKAFIEHGYTK